MAYLLFFHLFHFFLFVSLLHRTHNSLVITTLGNKKRWLGGSSPQAQVDHEICTPWANSSFRSLHHNGGVEIYPHPIQNQTGNVNQSALGGSSQVEYLNGRGANYLEPTHQLGYNSAFASNYRKFMTSHCDHFLLKYILSCSV